MARINLCNASLILPPFFLSPILKLMTRPLDALASTLKKFPQIKLAVVYGSFASGSENPGSDIDLGIAAERSLPSEELVEIQNALTLSTGREVDLIDLHQATGTVLVQAVTKGEFILRTDHVLLARILSRMAKDEADLEVLRRKILEERRKKVLSEG